MSLKYVVVPQSKKVLKNKQNKTHRTMGLHQRDTGINGKAPNGQNCNNLSNKINKTIKLKFKA